jgi:membrane glycosyltransferase
MAIHELDKRAARILPGTRIFLFFGFVLLITGAISLLFADLLWRRGWTAGSSILMCLFVPLVFFNANGAMHGIYGFWVRLRDDPQRITGLRDFEDQDLSEVATVILFPICNEGAAEVYARLKATYASLEKTGEIARFDFYILSDSTEAENWIDEETRWMELTRSLGAAGRIFYRRRLLNESKKSGNIRDFLNAFGNRYRYFAVFDADSFMSGQTIVTLVKLMEAHPSVGLIQTPPAAINAESLFGRMLQFANRLYAPLFTAGSNYWVQGFGNYVGHNAITRTEPFMKFCDLPHLPGKKPFGGQILSHDFVEAALLVKNHWRVWLAYDLEESYEEIPQGLIEFAQRDRRWCQGNLQHILVLFSGGLRGVSRLHLLFGIFGYLSGPLWLLFLITFNAQLFLHQATGLSDITVRSWTPFLKISAAHHALLIFAVSTVILLIPKFLALLDLARDRERARAFGGIGRASLSAFLELLFSTLQAPLLMLWHTEFVVSALLGRSVSWKTQNRQADGTSWAYALRNHWKHTLAGLIWGGVVWATEPALLGWMAPVLLGMLLSIPLTTLTSRRSAGEKARNARLFLTPEEAQPSEDIIMLRSALAAVSQPASTEIAGTKISRVIVDPYLNALHISLLKTAQTDPTTKGCVQTLSKDQPSVEILLEKALQEGFKALSARQKLGLLSNPESVQILHREVWARPPTKIGADWWPVLQIKTPTASCG